MSRNHEQPATLLLDLQPEQGRLEAQHHGLLALRQPTTTTERGYMSRSLNKITLIGRAGNDPEVRTTQSGTKVANISLATSRSWKDRNGGKQEVTSWHRLVIWDRLAEIAEQYISKGDRIYVEGRMEYGSYERDGVTIPTAEVVVHELIMLGGSGEREPVPAGRSAPAPGPFDDDSSDLPF